MAKRTTPSVDPRSIPFATYQLAYALVDAATPKSTWALTTMVNDQLTVTTELLDDVNLYIECGSAGQVEFQLEMDGGGVYTLQNVTAGQKLRGRFKRIGPGTNVFPLIGYGNSAQRTR